MGTGTPQRPPSGIPQGQPASTSNTEREPQTAVAPLNTIAKEDIAAASKVVDEWLRSFTGGYVTLERLTTVLGSIPIVGNIMALVDVFLDIVTILEKKSTDAATRFLNWASLGINLIGLIPAPPTMAAARMSLRPTLHLVKQELLHGARNLGGTIVTMLVGHLNASIVGELETFIDGAIARLSGILEDCARLSDSILDNLIGILQRVLGGQDLFTVARPGAAETNDYDPKTQSTWSGMWRRAVKYSEGTAKRAANYAARKAAAYLPESVRVRVNEVIDSLGALKADFRRQLADLANQELQGSIMWLLRQLLSAMAQKKSLRAAMVSPGAGAEARRSRPDTQVEHLRVQAPVKGDPGCKNCPLSGAQVPSSSKFAISLATGCESFTHVDFALVAPLPITWARTYRSNLGAFDEGSLGARWLTPYSTRVDIAMPAQGLRAGELSLIYHGADGRSHAYPLLAVGQSYRDAIEEATLTRLSETLLSVDFGKAAPAGEPGDWREIYELVDTAARKVATQGRQHFRLVSQHAGKEASIGLRYDHVIASTGEQVLSDIVSKQGDVTVAHVGTRPDARSGLITSLWEIKGGQVVRQLAAYVHDAEGDLVSAQDENGETWDYRYSHHLVTRYTDRTGRGMNLEYDGTGVDARAVREWSDDGSFALRLEWDRNIRLTYVTDALGAETWYYYDILGYTYRIIHPDTRQEWFFRDEAKNITRHVRTDGSTDDFSYDADGNLRAHTRADGSQVHFAHDSRGRMTGLRDAEGGVWTRDYDAGGNLVEEIDPLGHKTAYAYDKAGRPVRITDAKGGVKTLTYTPTGQLASHTDCSGKTTRWEYDEQGRLVKATDAMGHSTRYRYTSANEQGKAAAAADANRPGRLEEIILPDNSSEHFVHDAEGRLLAHTDALGRRTRYDYTRSGLVSQRTDAAGHTLKYRWDLLGRLSELHNENGSRYDFRYDPVGRLLEEVGFDRKTTSYIYDDSTGVLKEVVDGGQTTHLQFDPIGRLIERSADGAAESFAYDRNGRLVEAGNGDAKLQWFYDPAGNLTREHQHYLEGARTAVWQHGYDELNQRVATIRPDGHVTQWLTYGSGHVHGLLVDGQEILGFERDDLHREIAREQGNGLLQKQSHDPAGRLLEQQISQTRRGALQPTGIRRSYQYDRAGQLISIGDSRRGNLSYRYDPVGRLLEANSRLGRETFAFDPAGNIGNPSSEAEGTAEPAGRITHRVPVRAGADGRGSVGKLMDNLLKDYAGTRYKWDERGNLVERSRKGEKTVFTWDGYNRMRSAETFGETTTFSYDPLGRRIAKRTRHACTLFGWDGDTLAFESTQSTEGWQEHAWRGDSVHYIHEPGSFVPLVQIRRAQAVVLSQTTDVKALMADNGGRYDIDLDPLWNGEQSRMPAPFAREEIGFYQCDHLGTPQELTDHEGRVAWSASYKAWGEARQAISEAGRRAGFPNSIRFQGQYWDEETGLHYNRYRYYDPFCGRYVSRDPIGLDGGNNIYQYAPNPCQWVDPLGLARNDQKKQKPCQSKKNSTEPKLPEKVIAQDGALRLEHYVRSGDHAPAHFHLRGEGGLNIQIGQNGKPINRSEELTAVQRDFIQNNKPKLRSSVDKIQRWHRYGNLPEECE